MAVNDTTTSTSGNGQTMKSYMSVVRRFENSTTCKKENLFLSGLYYMQNEMPDLSALTAEQVAAEQERALYSKALLYLHTIPFRYENLKSKKIKSFFNRIGNAEGDSQERHGGLELVPYGFLVFVGGLIWRKRWIDENSDDPIKYGNEIYTPVTTRHNPLLVKYNGGVFFGYGKYTSDFKYNVEYKEIVNEYIDRYTENELVNLFRNFAENDFVKIMASCELKCVKTNGPKEDYVFPTSEQDIVTYNPDQDIVEGAMNETKAVMGHDDFMKLYNELEGNKEDLSKMLKVLKGDYYVNSDNTPVFRVDNFIGNYAMGFYNPNDGTVQSFFSDSNVIHGYFTTLYGTNAFVVTTGLNIQNESGSDGSFKKSKYDDYLKGFMNVVSAYAKRQDSSDKASAKVNVDDKTAERELRCSVYMEIKNIWDRWLCAYYNKDRSLEFFKVKGEGQKTLFNNFIFIDSFYTNIGHQLKLNCNELYNEYKSGVNGSDTKGYSRVAIHLGNVVSRHNCVMYAFPDYIGFDSNEKDPKKKEDDFKKTLADVFSPKPSSSVPQPDVTNKFVVVYTTFSQMLHQPVDRNNFNTDCFDIYSYKDGTKIAPSVFGNKRVNSGTGITPRMGYLVPAFCVEYSRQDNSYWTNINVSTTKFADTEVGAAVLAQIAEKGNSSKRQICFYGQDIYPIYQAYSYAVTIEMLGNAQIQPLMYFQLLNVPMFRGAYMVTRVEHDMSPGKMVTRVTGVRMSKVRVPFTKYWFVTTKSGKVVPQEADYDDSAGDGNEIMRAEGSVELDIADDNFAKAINAAVNNGGINCDDFVRKVYGHEAVGVKISSNLNPSGNGVQTMFNELDKSSDWEVKPLKTVAAKRNNWSPLYNGKEHPRCGDILFGLHDGKMEPGQDNKFDHAAIFLGFAAMRSSDMYVAEGLSVGGSVVMEKNSNPQIIKLSDSRMGLGTDIYTHYARCKKYEVKQKAVPKENNDDQRIVGIDSMIGDDGINISYGNDYYPYNTSTILDGKSHYTVKDLRGGDADPYIQENLKSVISKVLNPAVNSCISKFGQHYPTLGKKPNVTSGYRNQKQNEKCGGAAKSQHMVGQASDLQYGRTSNELKAYNVLLAKEIVRCTDWDQLILEYTNSSTDLRCNFIHVSYKRPEAGSNRRQIFKYNGSKYISVTKDDLLNFPVSTT